MALPAAIAAFISREGIKKAIKKFGEKAVKEATEEPIKGVTQARQKMMTPAQKSRARKTRQESGLSARRDMKDAKPPKFEISTKGLQGFRGSVKDLRPSGFKYKSSRSKKTDKDSGSDDVLSKFLSRIDKDPALRERVKSEFAKGRSGLFTKEALREYKAGKGNLFKRLNPTAEEVAQALSKKNPVKHNKGGMASAAKTITSKTTRSRNKTKPRGVGVALRGYGKALR